jgi:AraC-like DNA-binding protein
MHVQDISHEVGYNRNSYEHNGLWSKCTGESPSTQAHMKEKKKKKKRLSAVKKRKSTDFCLFCLAYQGVVVTVCSLSNSIDMPKSLYNLILKSCPGNL